MSLKHKEKFKSFIFFLISAVLIFFIVFINFSSSVKTYFLGDDFITLWNIKTRKHLTNFLLLFYPEFSNKLLIRFTVNLFWILQYKLWNLDAQKYHIMNILLHSGNAILVFVLLKIILKENIVPLITALIFASHPLTAEAVIWISGNHWLLCAFLYLLTLLCFYKWISTNISIYYVGALILSLFTFFANEIGITLPLILFLIYRTSLFLPYGPGSMQSAKKFSSLIPFVLLLCIYLIARFKLVEDVGVYKENYFLLKNWLNWIIRLPSLILFPLNSYVFENPWVRVSYKLAITVFIVLSLLMHKKNSEFSIIKKKMFFAIFCGVITLIPVMPLVWRIGYEFKSLEHSRYLYLPLINFSLFLSMLFVPKIQKQSFHLLIPAIVIIILNTFLNIRSNKVWVEAGDLARLIPQKVFQLYPNLPDNSILLFSNVPACWRGAWVYASGLSESFRLFYRKENIQTYRLEDQNIILKMPNFTLDEFATGNVYLFYFDTQSKTIIDQTLKVKEKSLLRKRLLTNNTHLYLPKFSYNFANPSDRKSWQTRNGTITLEKARYKVLNEKNILISPRLGIYSVLIDGVKITLRGKPLRKDKKATLKLTWYPSSQLNNSFKKIKLDNQFYTYYIPLSFSYDWLVAEKVENFILHLSDRPAEIQIRSIEFISPFYRMHSFVSLQ